MEKIVCTGYINSAFRMWPTWHCYLSVESHSYNHIQSSYWILGFLHLLLHWLSLLVIKPQPGFYIEHYCQIKRFRDKPQRLLFDTTFIVCFQLCSDALMAHSCLPWFVIMQKGGGALLLSAALQVQSHRLESSCTVTMTSILSSCQFILSTH